MGEVGSMILSWSFLSTGKPVDTLHKNTSFFRSKTLARVTNTQKAIIFLFLGEKTTKTPMQKHKNTGKI